MRCKVTITNMKWQWHGIVFNTFCTGRHWVVLVYTVAYMREKRYKKRYFLLVHLTRSVMTFVIVWLMRPPLTNIALFGFSISFGPLFSRARLDLWFLGLLHVSKMKTIQFKSFFPKKKQNSHNVHYYRQKTTTRGWAGFAMNIVIVLRMRNRRNVTSGHGDNKCEIAQRIWS